MSKKGIKTQAAFLSLLVSVVALCGGIGANFVIQQTTNTNDIVHLKTNHAEFNLDIGDVKDDVSEIRKDVQETRETNVRIEITQLYILEELVEIKEELKKQ